MCDCISVGDNHEALVGYRESEKNINHKGKTYLCSWTTETFRSVEEHAKRTNKCTLVICDKMYS